MSDDLLIATQPRSGSFCFWKNLIRYYPAVDGFNEPFNPLLFEKLLDRKVEKGWMSRYERTEVRDFLNLGVGASHDWRDEAIGALGGRQLKWVQRLSTVSERPALFKVLRCTRVLESLRWRWDGYVTIVALVRDPRAWAWSHLRMQTTSGEVFQYDGTFDRWGRETVYDVLTEEHAGHWTTEARYAVHKLFRVWEWWAKTVLPHADLVVQFERFCHAPNEVARRVLDHAIGEAGEGNDVSEYVHAPNPPPTWGAYGWEKLIEEEISPQHYAYIWPYRCDMKSKARS